MSSCGSSSGGGAFSNSTSQPVSVSVADNSDTSVSLVPAESTTGTHSGGSDSNVLVTSRVRTLAGDDTATMSGASSDSRPSTPTSSLVGRQHPMSERQQVALLMRQEYSGDSEPAAGSSAASPCPVGSGALSPLIGLTSTGTDRSTSSGPGSSRSVTAGGNVSTGGLNTAQGTTGATVDKKLFKRNDKGETQLHLAAKKGDLKLVKRLIKAGAEVNAQDNAGWTPLHESTIRNYVDVTKLLLRYGAAANLRGLHGETALHDAAANGHERILRCLLRHGADPAQCNDAGRTALDVARDAAIADLLRTGGRTSATLVQSESTSGTGAQHADDSKSCCSSGGSDLLDSRVSTPPVLTASASGSTDRQSPRLGLTIRLPSSGSSESSSSTSAAAAITPPTAPAVQEDTPCTSATSFAAGEVVPPVMTGPSTSEEPPPQTTESSSPPAPIHGPPPPRFFFREDAASSTTSVSASDDQEDPYAFKEEEEDRGAVKLEKKSDGKVATGVDSGAVSTAAATEVKMDTSVSVEGGEHPVEGGEQMQDAGDTDSELKVPPLRIRIPQQEKVAADAAAVEGEVVEVGNEVEQSAVSSVQQEEVQAQVEHAGEECVSLTEGQSVQKEETAGGASGSGSDSAAESSGGGEGRRGRGGRTLRSHTAALRVKDRKDRADSSSPGAEPPADTGEASVSAAVDQNPVACSTDVPTNPPAEPAPPADSGEVAAPPKKRKLRSRAEAAQQAAVGADSVGSGITFPSSEHPVSVKSAKMEIPENPVDKLQAVKKLLNQRLQRLVPVQPKAPKGYQDYLLVTQKYLLAGNRQQQYHSLLQSERSLPPGTLHPKLSELFVKQEEERHQLRLAHRAERDKLCLAAEQEVVREYTNAALAMAGQARAFSFCAVIADRDFTHLPGDFVDVKEESSGSSTSGAATSGGAEGSRCKQLSRHFITCLNEVVEKHEKLKMGLLCRHHHEADSLQAVQRLDWDMKLRELHLCDRREPRIGARIPRDCVPPVLVPENFAILPQKPV